MRPRIWLADAALFAGALLIAGFAARRGINPNDEGLMLAAADRIAHGELPWRDFWWVYGPAEPLGLAGLQELVGPSLLAWRVVHVLVAAGTALLAYRLVRREASVAAALAAWLTVVCALSFPLIPNPVGPALLLALGAMAAAPRRPLLAGVLAGAAVAFRLDVGAAAVLAAMIAGRAGGRRTARTLAAAVGDRRRRRRVPLPLRPGSAASSTRRSDSRSTSSRCSGCRCRWTAEARAT